MMTLRQFAGKPDVIPTSTVWALAELSEARGRQALFTKQSPQRLKVLREHALIESAVSSNRIEGVVVDQRRIGTLMFGKPLLRDRNEEEVQGYRDALKRIHEQGVDSPVSEQTIRALHRIMRRTSWDAGAYKQRDTDIIERDAMGRQWVRFKTVEAAKTKAAMRALIQLWHRCLEERWVHPLVALASFNLDFLCIHPFRDGNGRVSRLLFLLQSYRLGYEVGRYISVERIIEQHKDRYYDTLERSSKGWHQGRHDPWPCVNYLLFILQTAYKEFEARLGDTPSPKGAKTAHVQATIDSMTGRFTRSSLERACPGASRELIRRILKELQREGKVECLGRGPGAAWRKKGYDPEKRVTKRVQK